ncbi:hypothetical protein [Acetivibrio ethanolgignens]|uniref:Uncharacterized protein n=1 Tax=Acetivibrio ethanolgignens TaxID=290052 RepID=A0A0V8QII3_9FIRM|nr:hypothetical protein [Acetivibrio ethanolgignens]KSV60316.1 hypothetical protein ASU35_06075 [Acetivibrio ethanolgignens]
MAVIVRMPSKGGSNTKNVTAVPDDVLSGKVFVNSKGEEQEGNMPDNGAVAQVLNAGGSYTIPKGYHDGGGKITANSLASQTQANATAPFIARGKTAWVNGNKVVGTGLIASEIRGVKKDYYVYAGQTIEVGDFVQLTYGISGIGSGKAIKKTLPLKTSSDSSFITCKIDESTVLLLSKEADSNYNYYRMYASVIKINGVDISVGPRIQILEKKYVYGIEDSDLKYISDAKFIVSDSSHVYVLYPTSKSYDEFMYWYLTLNGVTISVSGMKKIYIGRDKEFQGVSYKNKALYKTSSGHFYLPIIHGTGTINDWNMTTYNTMYISINFLSDNKGTLRLENKTILHIDSCDSADCDFGKDEFVLAYSKNSDRNTIGIFTGRISGKTAKEVKKQYVNKTEDAYLNVCKLTEKVRIVFIGKNSSALYYRTVDNEGNISSSTLSIALSTEKIIVTSNLDNRLLIRNELFEISNARNGLLRKLSTKAGFYYSEILLLYGSKALTIYDGEATVINFPNANIDYLNYIYEIQAKLAISNDDTEGVALTKGIGGSNQGSGAKHNQKVTVVSKLAK